MNDKQKSIFRGGTERFIIAKLEEKGELTFKDISFAYSNQMAAKSLIIKLEYFGLASIDKGKVILKKRSETQ